MNMFVHHCTACERRQLIFLSQVTGVRGSDAVFTCWCGAEQTHAIGARPAAPAAA